MPNIEKIKDEGIKDFAKDINKIIQNTNRDLLDDLKSLERVERIDSLPTATIDNLGKLLIVNDTGAGADNVYIGIDTGSGGYAFKKIIIAEIIKSVMQFTTGTSTIGDSLTRYFGNGIVSDNVQVTEYVIPYACTISNLYTYNSIGVNGTRVYTVTKSGTATDLTCTATAVKWGIDSTHSASFVAGDRIAIKVVTSGGADTETHTATVQVTPA